MDARARACDCACACACAGMRAASLKKETRERRKIWALFMCPDAIQCVVMMKVNKRRKFVNRQCKPVDMTKKKVKAEDS